MLPIFIFTLTMSSLSGRDVASKEEPLKFATVEVHDGNDVTLLDTHYLLLQKL